MASLSNLTISEEQLKVFIKAMVKEYNKTKLSKETEMKKQVWYIYFTIYDGVKREDLNVWFPKQVEANTYVECLKEEWGDCLEKVAVRPGYVKDDPLDDIAIYKPEHDARGWQPK